MFNYTDETTLTYENFGVRLRAQRALANEGINNIGDLRSALQAHGMSYFSRIPNFGKKSLNDMQDLLIALRGPTETKPSKGVATPNTSICVLPIVDDDGETSHQVTHTVAGAILIHEYGKQAVDLDYKQARALAWALITLCEIHE